MFQNFSASYTSFLSVIHELKPFETVEDLYSQTNYKVGVLAGTATQKNFKNIHAPWSIKLINERWMNAETTEAAIDMIKQGDFAYLFPTQPMHQALKDSGGDCRIVQMGRNIYNGHLVFAWKKNFVYGPLLNYKLNQMMQAGIVDGIWSKYKIDNPTGCVVRELEALGMENLLGIFSLFLMGIFLSILLMIVEHLHLKVTELL